MNVPTADLRVRVSARSDVGPIAVLDLVPSGGGGLPGWAPGAHVDVLLAGGLVRQYSLCGTEPGRWRIAVLREEQGRGGSAALHAAAVVGAELLLAGPRNHFAFAPGPGPVLLIAAGIGITPILPMASAARAAGLDYRLQVLGRPGRLPFLDELAAHGYRLSVHLSGGGRRADLAALVAGASPGTTVYACGPRRLLDEVEALAARHGLDARIERFEPVQAPAPERAAGFDVDFAASGVTATVEPGQSILEVAEANGVFVLSSCQEGTCGTCETVVLEGEVDHRDSILTPAQRERGDVMYICVSRARGDRLVVEL